MRNEFALARAYTRAVLRHWWVIVVGVVLVLLDVIERTFGTWVVGPRWARVTIGVMALSVAQYLVYRDLQKSQLSASQRKQKLARLAEFQRTGRELTSVPDTCRTHRDFAAWAFEVDGWLASTCHALATEFGSVTIEKFVNDAGLRDLSYPGIPSEFHKQITVLNRRLENLDLMIQHPDSYL